jgi:hypothetical protein
MHKVMYHYIINYSIGSQKNYHVDLKCWHPREHKLHILFCGQDGNKALLFLQSKIKRQLFSVQ